MCIAYALLATAISYYYYYYYCYYYYSYYLYYYYLVLLLHTVRSLERRSYDLHIPAVHGARHCPARVVTPGGARAVHCVAASTQWSSSASRLPIAYAALKRE